MSLFFTNLKLGRNTGILFTMHIVCVCIPGTLGVSLSPCSVPGCLPSFDLPPGDMELGLGEGGWKDGGEREKVEVCKERRD